MTRREDGESPRQHYNAFIRKIGKWENLNRLVRDLDESKGIQKTNARMGVLHYLNAELKRDLRPNTDDAQIHGEISVHAEELRDNAREYFGENIENILGERAIPKSYLEKAVHDMIPAVKTDDERHDNSAQRHAAYLHFRGMAEAYSKGEIKSEDKEDLLDAIFTHEYLEKREGLIKEGKSERYANIKAYIEARANYFSKNREKIQERANALAESAKKEFEKGFSEDYTIDNYARESLRALAGDERFGPDRVMDMIYGIHKANQERE